MRNDSIETLLLRHYGRNAPAPVDLEQRLTAMVRTEAAERRAHQQELARWHERRISRRRVLQLVTFTGAGVGALVVGVEALQGSSRKPALSW